MGSTACLTEKVTEHNVEVLRAFTGQGRQMSRSFWSVRVSQTLALQTGWATGDRGRRGKTDRERQLIPFIMAGHIGTDL